MKKNYQQDFFSCPNNSLVNKNMYQQIIYLQIICTKKFDFKYPTIVDIP